MIEVCRLYRFEQSPALFPVTTFVNQDFSTHVRRPLAHFGHEVFGDCRCFANDPKMTGFIALISPRKEHNIKKLSVPQHVKPCALGLAFYSLTLPAPLALKQIKN